MLRCFVVLCIISHISPVHQYFECVRTISHNVRLLRGLLVRFSLVHTLSNDFTLFHTVSFLPTVSQYFEVFRMHKLFHITSQYFVLVYIISYVSYYFALFRSTSHYSSYFSVVSRRCLALFHTILCRSSGAHCFALVMLFPQ